jgi:hypothetical protein
MTEKELKDFLANDYEKKASDMCTRVVHAQWNHETDLNNEEKRKIFVHTIPFLQKNYDYD